MKVTKITFDEIDENAFGIVILGALVDTEEHRDEWVNGITATLIEHGCILNSENETPDDIWDSVFYSETTKGRHDLIFISSKLEKFDISRLAWLRLTMQDCKWVEDFLNNQAVDYNRPRRGPHKDLMSNLGFE